MLALVRLTASADGSPVFLNPTAVGLIRERTGNAGLPGTTIILAGGSEVVVREPLSQVLSAIEVPSGADGPS